MKKKIQLHIEATIDFIPHYKRSKKSKYFEFKILFIRVVLSGLF